jgi:general nucleoside transport system permease protein
VRKDTVQGPSPFAGRLSAIVAGIAILGLFVFPYVTYGRNFGGAGLLQLLVGGVMNLTEVNPAHLPDVSLSMLLAWPLLLSLLLTVWASVQRQSWLWISALLNILLAIAAMVALKLSLNQEIDRLLATGMKLNKIIYVAGGANLGLVLPLVAGIVAVVSSLSGFSRWKGLLERFRSALIPFVSILLSIVVGGIVILVVQIVPNGLSTPLTALQQWYGKADLIWFVYSTLIAPITNLADFARSLLLSTPLILTGLSVAFAFRAGMFNIGAPGQMIMGGIFAMLVGVYVPLPPMLLLPLTVIAAALGGAFWGGLVGWLKARFGSSEVINTIMMNYIASGILVFMIGSNTFAFFGKKYPLPFKAEGLEGKSADLQAGAKLPTLAQMIGLEKVGDTASLAWVAGLLVFGIVAVALQGRFKDQRRWIFAALGGLVATGLLWIPFTIVADGGLLDIRLNAAFLFIALLSALFFMVFLWRTAKGYEIRAVGLAPKAAEYGGINVSRNVILAMVISGAFAGLTATHYLMGGAINGQFNLSLNLPTNVGFDGITVALLGQSTPWGVVASSIFFGVLDTGGLYVDQKLDALTKDIVTVIKATIVFFIAVQGFLSKKVTSPAPILEHKQDPKDDDNNDDNDDDRQDPKDEDKNDGTNDGTNTLKLNRLNKLDKKVN